MCINIIIVKKETPFNRISSRLQHKCNKMHFLAFENVHIHHTSQIFKIRINNTSATKWQSMTQANKTNLIVTSAVKHELYGDL